MNKSDFQNEEEKAPHAPDSYYRSSRISTQNLTIVIFEFTLLQFWVPTAKC